MTTGVQRLKVKIEQNNKFHDKYFTEIEFDLSEWDTHQLSRCAEALVTARIPHRWESAIVVVSEHDALATEKLIESFDDLGIEIILDES